jgi:hypothetical protein
MRNILDEIRNLAYIKELEKIAKKGDFKRLEKNKVPLTDEERKEVMRRKAIWHHGPNGEATPAVWKSVNNGKTIYITNTHRAFQKRKNIGAAINVYHSFIKGTA